MLLGVRGINRVMEQDFQLKQNFEVSIITPNVLVENNELMSFLVTSADFEDDKLNFSALPTGHRFLEKIEFSREVTLSFRETKQGYVRNYMQEWQNLNYNKLRRVFVSYPSVLEKRLAGAWRNIIISNIDEADINYSAYILKDAVPSNIGGISFDYGDGEVQMREVSFEFQDYEVISL